MRSAGRFIPVIVLIHLFLIAFASAEVRREIKFPDILDYKTLKCDFHMHTVFSDGLVWPTVRVDEAWREGLDVISITDHIEYQPHKDDIPTKHNRSYEIAASHARSKNILLIRGAEITRDTPPGHFNAIFLKDINPLDTAEHMDSIKAAVEQDALVFWNHPGWQPDKEMWVDFHTKLLEKKWMHGIEVVNGDEYYPEALQWCLEHNLTMFGNSDIHQPSLLAESTSKSHRTMTLVFAKERTVEAVKEALVGGKTVVWSGKNQLIGREKYLAALFNASLKIDKPYRKSRDTVWFLVTNCSSADIELRKAGNPKSTKLILPAETTTMMQAKADEGAEQARVFYRAVNFLIAPDKPLGVEISVPLK